MHILRWLLTHPIIFAWALAILAILLNYGVGGSSGEDTHQAEAEHATEQVQQAVAAEGEVVAKAQHAVGEVAEAADAVVDGAVAETAEAADAVVTEVEVKEAVAETTDAASDAVEEVKAVVADTTDSASGAVAKVAAVAAGAVTAVVAGSAAADAGDEVQAEASAEAAAETQAVEVAEVVEATTETASAEVVETAEATTETVSTEAVETAEVATQETAAETSDHDLLHAAREAYWSDEFDSSAEFYQSLLARDSQPAIKGELANVFWKQGKSAEALALYAEIAPWLREQNRTTELQNMKVYADIVDPAKGEEIGAWLE